MAGGYKLEQGSHAAALANGERLLATKPALAVTQARALLDEDPQDRAALHLLARAHDRLGQPGPAIAAREAAMRLARRLPAIDRAFAAMARGRPDEALKLLAPHLAVEPDEPLGTFVAGEALHRTGQLGAAATHLARAVAQAPGFVEAQMALARVRYARFEPDLALEALKGAQGHPDATRLRAALLGETGDHAGAEAAWRALAAAGRDDGALHLSHGDALRTLGRTEDAARAYRAAIGTRRPALQAWWSLASLGGRRIEDAEIPCLAELEARERDAEVRVHLNFALGAAHDARGQYGEAFARYARGNALRRQALDWDAKAFARRQQAIARDCGADFLAARAGWGAQDAAPVFVVGMARSGSTLLEQALARHPQVETCGETPALPAVMLEAMHARGFDPETQAAEFLLSLGQEDCRLLGEDYLRRVSVRRREGRTRFIDKMPHNWAESAFIRLVLPRAAIVDIRRGAADCCLSNFALLFAPGHPSSYGIDDWIAYFTAYRDFMAEQPGVIGLRYEALIDDFEGQLRRVLDELGLGWDAACLDFASPGRAVATASAEQVRRPLNRDGIGAWRRFEPWLGEWLPRLETLDGPDRAIRRPRSPARPRPRRS